jgi:SPX domain protein involved in polyphosphate accumulation
MNHAQVREFMERAGSRLVPDVYHRYTVYNVYCDTADDRMVINSLEHPEYKEKMRIRSYVEPTEGTPVFLEIKKKYNGIVYKRRVQTETRQAECYMINGTEPEVNDRQIFHEIQWFRRNYDLMPRVFLAYDRLAFKCVEDPELRITFDRRIRYRTEDLNLEAGDHGTLLLPENQILMEIKIPGAAPVWLSHILSELEIFPVSFSKYGKSYQKIMEEQKTEVTYRAKSA